MRAAFLYAAQGHDAKGRAPLIGANSPKQDFRIPLAALSIANPIQAMGLGTVPMGIYS